MDRSLNPHFKLMGSVFGDGKKSLGTLLERTKKIKFKFTDFLTIIVFISLVLQLNTLYTELPTRAIEFDEEFWFSSTYYYHLMFNELDFFHEDWQEVSAYDQPPIGKYLLGLVQTLRNQPIPKSRGNLYQYQNRMWIQILRPGVNANYGYSHSDSDRELLEHIDGIIGGLKPAEITPISQEQQNAGRYSIFVFTILIAVAILVLGFVFLKQRLATVCAAYLLFSNRLTNIVYQVLYIDAIAQFLTLMSVITLILFFRRIHLADGSLSDNWPRSVLGWKNLLAAFSAGLMLALAMGTKFSTVPLLATLLVGLFLNTISSYLKNRPNGMQSVKRSIIFNISMLVLVSGSALFFFFISNPFFYPDPIGNSIKMIEYRLIGMQVQTTGMYPKMLPGEKYDEIFTHGIFVFNKHAYDFFQEPYLFLILFLGIWSLLKKSYDELMTVGIGAFTVVTLWIILTFLITSYGIHMAWPRYFVIFVTCSAFVWGMGIETLIRSLKVDRIL